MNRIAVGLLLVSAVALVGFGTGFVVYWTSSPFGRPYFGAGEAFGVFVGVVTAGIGLGLALAARAVWRDRRGGWTWAGVWAVAALGLAGIALTTPGPPPVPLPISIGGAVIGLALIGLVIARALGRRART